MSWAFLPYEVLGEVFCYLAVSDLLAVSLVSRQWREAASFLLADGARIMITEDVQPALETFSLALTPYHHWVFKEVDLNIRGPFGTMWKSVAPLVKSLMLLSVETSEKDFFSIMQHCTRLEELRLNGLAHIFMTGNFLSLPEDVSQLSSALQNVTRLHLSCSRYLTDVLFSRVTSVVGPLTKMSLSGCQISYANSIHKRFYPSDGRITASDHVLTFQHILHYIAQNAATLKKIALGKTTIDSESLAKLASIPGLKLESVHLMSCEQLTKAGIQSLCEHQHNLVDLDLSLCNRITDPGVLSICEKLPKLKKLNLRSCNSLTETSIQALSKLQSLEKLDISNLDSIDSSHIEIAIGKNHYPSLKWLSLASLPLECQTILTFAEKMPNLIYLDLSMCVIGVNDRSVQAICKHLVKLRTLNLSGCAGVSDIGLAGHGLAQNERSPTSGLAGLSLENLGLKRKNAFKINLGLKAERQIRDEAEVTNYLKQNIHQIVNSSEYGISNLTGLRELNLCKCARITDITLVYALHLQELKILNLSHCQQVGEDGLLLMIKNCPSLENLNLNECPYTSDQVVMAIGHHLKRIQVLDLQRCSMLTDDSLDSLSYCKSLRYLDISGCDKMSLEEVLKLKCRIPRLHDLHHRGIKPKELQISDNDAEFQLSRPPPPPPFLKKLKNKLSS